MATIIVSVLILTIYADDGMILANALAIASPPPPADSTAIKYSIIKSDTSTKCAMSLERFGFGLKCIHPYVTSGK